MRLLRLFSVLRKGLVAMLSVALTKNQDIFSAIVATESVPIPPLFLNQRAISLLKKIYYFDKICYLAQTTALKLKLGQ